MYKYKRNKLIDDSTKLEKKLQLIGNVLFLLNILFNTVVFAFSVVYVDVVVSGASMQPTINSQWSTLEPEKKDKAYINRLDAPERGDIIVVEYGDIFVIKRLIAVGGDTVEIKLSEDSSEVEIFVMGELLKEDYIIFKQGNFVTLNNYNNLKLLEPELFNGNVLTVPAGYVFYLGDNRAVSQDSSVVGPVRKDYVYGKVSIITDYGKSFLEDMFEDFFEMLMF